MTAVPAIALLDTTPLWQDVVVVGSSGVLPHVAATASIAATSRVVTVESIREARTVSRELTAPIFCITASRHLWRDLESVEGPVIVIGPRCRRPPVTTGEMVVCLDSSRRAEHALPAATALAGRLGLRLTLVTVAGAAPVSDAAHVMYHDVLEGNYLARTAARLRPTSTELTWEVLHGRPDAAVAAYSDRDRAAFVAVNSHGESTAPGAPCGRFPARLVATSAVPVLVTRRRREDPRPSSPPPPSRPAPARRGNAADGGVARTRPEARKLEAAALAYRVRGLPVDAPPPPRGHRSMSRRSIVTVALAVALAVAAALVTLPAPYYTRVGASLVAADMISVERPVEPLRRDILVTFVRNDRLTHLGALRGWLDPDRDVAPLRQARSADPTATLNQHLMSDAATTARALVAAHLGGGSAPFDAIVDTHGLGGPSAGLAFALEILDQLTPGRLTGGRTVAATGALNDNGEVMPVAGTGYKAVAAKRAGADVFLVPVANLGEARRAAPGLRVEAVRTFADAQRVVTSL